MMAEDEGEDEMDEGLQDSTLTAAAVNEETNKEYGTLELP